MTGGAFDFGKAGKAGTGESGDRRDVFCFAGGREPKTENVPSVPDHPVGSAKGGPPAVTAPNAGSPGITITP